MECSFKIGEQVVCVDDGTDPNNSMTYINPRYFKQDFYVKKGNIYTITDIQPYLSTNDYITIYIGLQFGEVPTRDPGYGHYRFKPLTRKETDISVFTEISNKVNNEKKVLDEVH